MKWRLTYKEVSLIIGIAVALLILLTFWIKGNPVFQLSENINFTKSLSFRYIQELVSKVSTDF